MAKKKVTLPITKAQAEAYLTAMELTPSGVSAGPTGAEKMGTIYKEIDFVPPENVAQIALEALRDVFVRGLRGGTEIGYGRAVQLALRMPVPPRDIRRMVNYGSRHRKDLSSRQALLGKKTPGVIAMDLWGGSSGIAWAETRLRQMELIDAGFSL